LECTVSFHIPIWLKNVRATRNNQGVLLDFP
jgi:hypothetical protein